ncbi:bile acid:sodium symporter family protein [Paeniglutamicibacter sp. ZC-3]|uniref:bile acid:sodium symporter family protein n=1 Tax=Paeniglutamicibacter sp. ZC-3 TaxID=2986919 RepID=UPI0021F72677|nr:bile acid:sodium symporter family protein [Paeniglutamicibacter sp. ZC-3]MCV9996623.1 bile acid:sodium symporter family protein [Paeniglutamicibacter sp. ZC-3]
MSTETARERRSARIAVLVFPLIIVAAGAFGIFAPTVALPLNPLVPLLLGVVMFTMGLTMKAPDLKLIVRMPQAVAIGFVAQFTIMPLAGLGLAVLFGFEPLLVVGMVLLGSVPGGASSNIVAYLSRGNVALSVAMTSLSTILAPFITPFIVLWLAGSYLPVDFASMFTQIMQITIIPVILGVVLKLVAGKFVDAISAAIPWISVAVLSLVIAGIMARSASVVMASAGLVIVAVILHNAIGFALGYTAAWAGRLGPRERRAVAVEVGMQNAGLAAALANSNYGPLASLPAAVATIWHNIGGALLATLFGVIERRQEKAKLNTVIEEQQTVDSV